MNVTFRDRAARRLLGLATRGMHTIRRGEADQKDILFIVGCQRSGTTLMTRIFERDLNASVYKEKSRLSSLDVPKRLRLDPLPRVREVITRDPAPFVVLKPLVESQNVQDLLDAFPGSRALWMYRDFRGVAHSYVEKWGPGHSVRDLRPICEDEPGNWRNERVTPEERSFIREHFSENMADLDASALYWHARNSHVRNLGLHEDDRIKLVRYEWLTEDPAKALSEIYGLVGRIFPGARLIREVQHSGTRSRHRPTHIADEIADECDRMLAWLDDQAGYRPPRT